MELERPSPQRSPSLPNIPADKFVEETLVFHHAGTAIPIITETRTAIPTAASSNPTTAPLPSTTPMVADASSSSTPTPYRGTPYVRAAAIVVPIVALVLLTPLIFLLYRSHQLKKRSTKRRRKRASAEAMLQRQPSASKGPMTLMAPVDQLRTRQRPPRIANGATKRPTNSFGLFNFDISPPHTTGLSSPVSPSSPPLLSIACAVEVCRSEVSVIDGRRAPSRRSNNCQSSLVLPNPPPPYILPERQSPHFAPLDQIGSPPVRNPSRSNLTCNPSSGAVSALPPLPPEALGPPEAYDKAYTQSLSPPLLFPITRGDVDWGRMFPHSECGREGTNRHSYVSSISDEEGRCNRQSQQSELISPIHEQGGMQPFPII